MRCTQCPTSASSSGMPFGVESVIDRLPRRPFVVAAKRAGRRDGDEDSTRVLRTHDDRVQAHPARPGLPGRAGLVVPQSRQLTPTGTAIDGAKQGRVLNAREHRVAVAQRGLEVPDPGELPRVGRPVVPLVRTGHAVVGELIAHGLPTSGRRRRNAELTAQTNSSTARRRSDSDPPESPSRERPPIRQRRDR